MQSPSLFLSLLGFGPASRGHLDTLLVLSISPKKIENVAHGNKESQGGDYKTIVHPSSKGIYQNKKVPSHINTYKHIWLLGSFSPRVARRGVF